MTDTAARPAVGPSEGVSPDADPPALARPARARRADDGVVLLRLLPWPKRLVVWGLMIGVVAPVIMAYLRAQAIVGHGPRFAAFGDSAYLALRSRDVFTGHLPLIGSQSSAESNVLIMQPGPAQFYAQAPFTALFGGDLGTLVFAGVATVLAAVGSVWVTLRRFGVAGAFAAAVVVVALEAQMGSGALVDSISSTHGQLLMFFAVLATVLTAAGDARLFPVAVAAASYALQVHLSFVGYALVLTPLLATALIVGLVQARRGLRPWFTRWAIAGVIVGTVVWIPPLIDQFFGTGNLGNVISAGGGEAATAEIGRTGRQLLSGLASTFGPIPTLFAPPDRLLGLSSFQRGPPGILIGLAVGAAAAAAGLWLVLANRRRGLLWSGPGLGSASKVEAGRDSNESGPAGESQKTAPDWAALKLASAGLLLVTGVMLALVGVLFASRLRGFAIVKPNNNRWMVIAGAVVWLGSLVAMASSSRVGRLIGRPIPLSRRHVLDRVLGTMMIALVGLYSLTVMARPLEPTVADPWMAVSGSLAAQVDEAWDDPSPVRVFAVGATSAGGIQPAVMLHLEERGRAPVVVGGLPALRAGFGEHRLADGMDPPYVRIQDGDIALPDSGRLLRVIIAQPLADDGAGRGTRAQRCLDRAVTAGGTVILTDAGSQAATTADPHTVSTSPDDQLLVASLRDPQLLFLTGLVPEALRRGFIEPPTRSGCEADELRDLGGELYLTTWLVE